MPLLPLVVTSNDFLQVSMIDVPLRPSLTEREEFDEAVKSKKGKMTDSVYSVRHRFRTGHMNTPIRQIVRRNPVRNV